MRNPKGARSTRVEIVAFCDAHARHNVAMYYKIVHLHSVALALPDASNVYNFELVYFARQQQIRLDKSIKHLICKACYHTLSNCRRFVQDGRLFNECAYCSSRVLVGKVLK